MNRLREEFDWSRDALKHSRKMYRDTFERYAGDRYQEHSRRPETYLLLTRMAFHIMRRHLVSQDIKVLTSTASPDLMAVAENLRLGLDDTLKRLDLAEQMESVVTAAIAKMGILWVGLDYFSFEGGSSARVASDFIDFGEWTHDMWARNADEFNFAGHRRRVRFSSAMEHPLFRQDVVHQMQQSAADRWSSTEESVDDLSGRSRNAMERTEWFEYDSIWLPRSGVVIGLPVDGPAELVHDPIEWEGVESGPYHILSFDRIPNNILGSPPSDVMAYLDDLVNSILRKMAESARNAKTIGLYRPGSADDAERIRNAGHLDFLATQNPDAVNMIEFNGVSTQSMGAFLQMQRLFSWANGGLETLGGLATGADTARQEQILLQSAGGMIDDMKSKTIKHITGVVNHIAHYLWRDEMWRPTIARHIPGIGSIGTRFEVEDRLGDLSDYRIDVSPYTSGAKTPQSKFQAYNVLLTQVAPALLQLAQTGAIDFSRAVKHYARVLDVDEVEDIFNLLDTTGMPGPEHEPERQDAEPRRYIRESVSGQTPEAKDQQIMAMMSGDDQS